ncbi:MAG: hypothetical protein PHT44_01405 [Candidatus Portnoybacteria bacterium]|nr:hypothetical protein [Candidatus Portnoybacteria bacterium]MDD4982747.1 hypothetical protein [Candidatus Portnoybacteria bacterium]
MNIPNALKFKKTRDLLVSLLTRHPAWCLWTLAFLLTIYALVIFGAYAVKNPNTGAQTGLQIKKDIYQEVLSRLKARDTNIQQGIGQTYPDIFK